MKQTIVIVFLLLMSWSCKRGQESGLTIATSANMQFAMAELVIAFENKTGNKVDLVISSSGKLTAQIMVGAPYDLFFSADKKFPQKLFEDELTIGEPAVYAYGKLVQYTSLDSADAFSDQNVNKDFKIALANPKTAPYGQAAVEYLKTVGNYEELKSHFIFGESIAQVNQFLVSGAAEMGFTTLSAMHMPPFNEKGFWREIPSPTYSPIAQSMVRLKRGNSAPKISEAFFNFVLSTEGQEILNKFGYSTPLH